MDNVYSFTNENVTSFNSLYNFSNAKVLSVLGSGDQYFSSLLYGAKDVELYDINGLAWDFFVLKYYGIMILSYEEFYDYFVDKKLNDLKYFKRLIPYLPVNIANRLSNLYLKYTGLSHLLYTDFVANINYNDGQNIPYFDCEKYYQLQSILLSRDLPTFYLTKLEKLPEQISNKSYDILLTSNVFYWMYPSDESARIKEYKEILNRFNCKEIQALYSWTFGRLLEKKFTDNGFDIDRVPSATKKLQLYDDTVVSLRKK